MEVFSRGTIFLATHRPNAGAELIWQLWAKFLSFLLASERRQNKFQSSCHRMMMRTALQSVVVKSTDSANRRQI
jgi:hypothetical protein